MVEIQASERRWSTRRTFIMAVTLYYQDLPINQCKTRDIGPEGVFVEVDGTPFDLHDMVYVSLPAAVIGERHRRRIPAIVTHKRDKGLGLMFCSFDQRLFDSLETLIHSLPSSHAA